MPSSAWANGVKKSVPWHAELPEGARQFAELRLGLFLPFPWRRDRKANARLKEVFAEFVGGGLQVVLAVVLPASGYSEFSFGMVASPAQPTEEPSGEPCMPMAGRGPFGVPMHDAMVSSKEWRRHPVKYSVGLPPAAVARWLRLDYDAGVQNVFRVAAERQEDRS